MTNRSGVHGWRQTASPSSTLKSVYRLNQSETCTHRDREARTDFTLLMKCYATELHSIENTNSTNSPFGIASIEVFGRKCKLNWTHADCNTHSAMENCRNRVNWCTRELIGLISIPFGLDSCIKLISAMVTLLLIWVCDAHMVDTCAKTHAKRNRCEYTKHANNDMQENPKKFNKLQSYDWVFSGIATVTTAAEADRTHTKIVSK